MSKIKNILGHIGLATLIYIIIFLLSKNILASYLASIFFYIGRERRDYEIKEEILVKYFYKGWNIFKWDLYDLVPPMISGLLISIGLYYVQ